MKTNLFLLFAAIGLFFACGEKTKFDGEVKFEYVELAKSGTEIDPDTTKSYETVIRYHKIIEAPEYLKDSINKQNRLFLSNWFDVPAIGSFDINQLVTDDMRDFYKQVDELDDKECFTCRIKNITIKADNVYQNSELVSIVYSWYIYEGGAHGNHGVVCYNYEKTSGKRINYKSLVKNEAKLLEIAEKLFKKEHGIGEDEDITGLFRFENNKFSLNDNFSFSKEGIVFHYNPYEIAPYSAGLIELVLPYEQLKDVANYTEHN